MGSDRDYRRIAHISIYLSDFLTSKELEKFILTEAGFINKQQYNKKWPHISITNGDNRR
jgi:hypothetical protein